MDNVFLNAVAEQGFVIILLVSLIGVLYKRQTAFEVKNEQRSQEMKAEIETLHNERKQERQELVSLVTELKILIQENNRVISDFSRSMNGYQKNIGKG